MTAGIATVIITLACWSSVPLFIRHFAERDIDLWTSNGWRYGVSAAFWLPVVLWHIWRRSQPVGIWRKALAPGILNAAGQICFAWAFYQIDPAVATFGLRTQIIFVAVGAALLFPNERAIIRSRQYMVGAALVLVGSMSIFFAGRSPPSLDHAAGLVLAVLSGLFFAGYGLSVRKYMHGVDPLAAFSVISQYTAAIIVSLMISLGADHGQTVLDPDILSRSQFGWLLTSGLIGIAFGHVFYYMAISRLGVAVSSGILQLQPFCVAVAQLALGRGEPLTGAQWIAGVVAVVGASLILGVQWRFARSARPAFARSADFSALKENDGEREKKADLDKAVKADEARV